jgi:hypothetical protein
MPEVVNHAGCERDPASCPDPMTCEAFLTVEDAREYQRLEDEAQQAVWEAERITYEEEMRRAESEADSARMRELTSWAPVDLGALIAGGLHQPETRYLSRQDGVCLLYPGRIHSFVGSSEHGKSLAAYMTCAQELLAGNGVVYVDFEGEGADFARWLLNLGVPADVITSKARYVRPSDPLDNTAKLALRHAVLEVEPTIAVFDGVTEAMMLHDLDDRVGTQVAEFMRMFAKRFEKVGIAVILIDHVPHDGNRATGSQHKNSAVTGASYLFVRTAPLVPGRHGKVEVSILKDRPGTVRTAASGGKKVGTLHVMPSPERPEGVEMYLEPPTGLLIDLSRGASSGAMERVSRYVEDHAGISRTSAYKSAGGDWDDNKDALDVLVEEGYLTLDEREHGTRTFRKYTSLRGFRA